MKSGCLWVTLIILFFAFLISDKTSYQVDTPPEDYPKPQIDPNREVIGFDWHKMEYKYRDQLPKDTQPVKEIPPMPDFYVSPMPGTSTRSTGPSGETQILKGGKRYRVNVMPDGTLQLIPIR